MKLPKLLQAYTRYLAMPSLPTNNSSPLSMTDTYGHYLVVANFNFLESIETWIKMLAMTLCFCGLMLSINYIFVYVFLTYTTVYERYYMYYLNDIYIGLTWFIAIYGFIDAYLSNNQCLHQNVTKHGLILKLFPLTIINCIVIICLSYLYHSNFLSPVSILCSVFDCIFFDIFFLYIFGIGFCVVLIVNVVTLHGCLLNDKRKSNTNNNLIEYRSVSRGDSIDSINCKNNSNNDRNNDNNQTDYDVTRLITFLIRYVIVLNFLYCFVHLYGIGNHNFTAKYFEYVYICLVLFTSLLKFIMKRIARQIDYIRNYYNFCIDSGNNPTENMSFEIMTEIIVSSFYSCSYRFLIINDIPSLKSFLILKAIHMSGEIFQSSMRMSQWWYHTSLQFERKLILGDIDNSKCNRCQQILLYLIQLCSDDSTWDQWQNRCMLDVSIRFVISIASAIFIASEFIVAYSYWSANDITISRLKKAVFYTYISLIIQCIHIITVGIFSYVVYDKYNIFTSIILIYNKNKPRFTIMFGTIIALAFLQSVNVSTKSKDFR